MDNTFRLMAATEGHVYGSYSARQEKIIDYLKSRLTCKIHYRLNTKKTLKST